MAVGEHFSASSVLLRNMPSRRAMTLVGFVVAIGVVQIALEDVIIFFAATGSPGLRFLGSPAIMIAFPFVLFLLLAGVLYTWAIGTDDTLR